MRTPNPSSRVYSSLPPETISTLALIDSVYAEVGIGNRLAKGIEVLAVSIGAEAGAVFLFDRDTNRVSIVAQGGQSAFSTKDIDPSLASLAKEIILEGSVLVGDQVSTARSKRRDRLLKSTDFKGFVGVPLGAAGRVEHALILFSSEHGTLRPDQTLEILAAGILFHCVLEEHINEQRTLSISKTLLAGQLSPALVHELTNRLAVLELRALGVERTVSLLSGQEGAKEPLRQLNEQLDVARDAIKNMRRTLSDFAKLIRPSEEIVAVDILEILQLAMAQIAHLAKRHEAQIVLHEPNTSPRVKAVQIRLQQLLLNVLLNALIHTSGVTDRAPQIDIRVSQVELRGRDWVQIAVSDNGPGIRRENWQKVFTLGYTSRSGGSGLGLYIAELLSTSMGGQIRILDSDSSYGTTFLIELPVA